MAVVLVRPFCAGFTEFCVHVGNHRSSSRYGGDLDPIRSDDPAWSGDARQFRGSSAWRAIGRFRILCERHATGGLDGF